MNPIKPEKAAHAEVQEPGPVTHEDLARLIQENEALGREVVELRKVIADIQQVRDALQKSEENLKGVMNTLPQSVHLIDNEGTILASNDVSPRRLGISPDNYIGTNIFSHLPPDLAEKRKEYFQRVIREKTPVCWEDARDDRFYSHDILPIFDETGNVSRVVHVGLDVTEKKQIEDAIFESEEKYRTLVELSPDAILIHQQGQIVYANPATAELRGLSNPDDLVGRNMFDMIHPDFHTTILHNIRDALEEAIPPPTELHILRTDGTLATCEGRGKKVPFKGQTALLVILRDISSRKKTEMELKQYSENLKRINEDLELFASIAAHDLQEPVRGIVLYSQILLNECREGKNPQVEKYLKVIERAGLQMNTLVSDLRAYSRVRTQADTREAVDMGEVLSNAVNNLRLLIRETSASITSDQLPVLRADASQMTQVFQNIIDNAIKFRREGITPEIHVSGVRSDDMWQFSIRDNGIGIPAQYFDKIFVLFERLHGRDDYPGTGLGLALCKRIIERHGGRIWVESLPGEGSTFFFSLPA